MRVRDSGNARCGRVGGWFLVRLVALMLGCGGHAPTRAQLTVVVFGHGVVTDPIQCDSRCTVSVEADTAVVLEARPSDSSVPEWSVAGCSGLQCPVTVNGDLTVVVRFAPNPPPPHPPQFTLTVRAQGDGHGTVTGGPIQCGSQCRATLPAGSAVALEAQPASDSAIGEWSVPGCSGTRCQVAIDVDVTVDVRFSLRAPPPSGPRRLTVVAQTRNGAPFDGNPWSNVSIDAPGATITTPSASTLVAVASAGTKIVLGFYSSTANSYLKPWRATFRGNCVPMADGCALTLDEDTTITAVVEQNQIAVRYMLADSATIGSVISDSPRFPEQFWRYDYMRPGNELAADILDPGQTVTVSAVPGPRSHLGQWSGLCTGPATLPCQIVATPDNRGGQVWLRFDPDVDPRYQVAAIIPLDTVNAVKGSHIAGTLRDQSLAYGKLVTYDASAGVVTQLPVQGTAFIRGINRRGDVVGRINDHPFVAWANGSYRIVDHVDGKPFSGEFIAINDAGLIVGNADTNGTNWSDPKIAQPFTVDGETVTMLPIQGFTALAINSSALIVGFDATSHGAFFQSGQLTSIAGGPLAAVNSIGVAAGTTVKDQYTDQGFLWDGAGHELEGVWSISDLDDTGTVVGALDFGGRCTRRADCGYVPRLHGAIFTAGAAEDLNFLVDTSGTAEIAHRELNAARAIDGGRIVACFKDSRCAILEPTTKAR